MTLDNSRISVHLGKTSQYKSTYDPDLLVREPRQSNRTHLGISDDNLPFFGNDTWNVYEVSGLTNDGLPVTGIAKIVYPCSSKYIVESKSLKLYFNSFNMTKLGDTVPDVIKNIEQNAAADLSALLETQVKIVITNTSDSSLVSSVRAHSDFAMFQGLFTTLEKYLPRTKCDVYSEDPSLLQIIGESDETLHYRYHSSLLKSNCRVTSQPDWGDVYISFSTKKILSPESLLKYIVSFRDECHFHEEICEAIYQRLYTILEPTVLDVMCLYVRRGGIDICPERTSNEKYSFLSDPLVYHVKTLRQ